MGRYGHEILVGNDQVHAGPEQEDSIITWACGRKVDSGHGNSGKTGGVEAAFPSCDLRLGALVLIVSVAPLCTLEAGPHQS